MEQFNAEAKALVEMQNEYVLLTSKNPSEMCHDDFIRAEELNVQIKDATKVMAALAIEFAGYKKDEKGPCTGGKEAEARQAQQEGSGRAEAATGGRDHGGKPWREFKSFQSRGVYTVCLHVLHHEKGTETISTVSAADGNAESPPTAGSTRFGTRASPTCTWIGSRASSLTRWISRRTSWSTASSRRYATQRWRATATSCLWIVRTTWWTSSWTAWTQ